MKDLKYLMGYTLPLMAIIGLAAQGIWSMLTPIVAFAVIPVLELLLPQDASNLNPKDAHEKQGNPIFDFFLYVNIPIIFSIVGYYLWWITTGDYSDFELLGITASVGIALGSNGINVAHELGHRQIRWERILGKALLLPSLYMHFFIDHNFGHHLTVATPEDPSSAKYNQPVYYFWGQAILGEYINAWRLQKQLLSLNQLPFFSVKNDMFWFVLFQLLYLIVVLIFLGPQAFGAAIAVAFISVLLLQTINYIEHYGLRRRILPSGRYERAAETHSWNSNHVLGRMMLYELTRHSDHHHRAHKKYQLLEHREASPQMPYGYPASMVICLIPPLWFSLMNPRIPSEMKP